MTETRRLLIPFPPQRLTAESRKRLATYLSSGILQGLPLRVHFVRHVSSRHHGHISPDLGSRIPSQVYHKGGCGTRVETNS
jgi:hypothetical protein